MAIANIDVFLTQCLTIMKVNFLVLWICQCFLNFLLHWVTDVTTRAKFQLNCCTGYELQVPKMHYAIDLRYILTTLNALM